MKTKPKEKDNSYLTNSKIKPKTTEQHSYPARKELAKQEKLS